MAEHQGQVAGYVNVYPDSQWGASANRGYPEIVDFGVLEPYRRQGVGSKLMDLAEEITAAQYAEVVYLGVGLHRGWRQAAQRMYVKRGYLPGFWHWRLETVKR
ncbi:MAG: GNAT family N-acetyltransferase [Oscillospiraceae bacterium]